MREIKFRGKRCKNRKWVYGYYVESDSSWNGGHPHKSWILYSPFTNGGWFALKGKSAVIDNTVGQFTGCLDKNGTEIYEGDIVRWVELKSYYGNDFTPLEYYFIENIGVIYFENGVFGIKTEDISYVYPVCWLTGDYFTFDQDFSKEEFEEALLNSNLENPPKDIKDVYMVEVIGNIHDNPELVEQ